MKKQRYMVVDDDTTNNMICEFTIKRLDKEADIKMFVISEEALASIKEEYSATKEALPTILFLDVNMPSMTGWEFLDVFLQFDECVKDQFTIYIYYLLQSKIFRKKQRFILSFRDFSPSH